MPTAKTNVANLAAGVASVPKEATRESEHLLDILGTLNSLLTVGCSLVAPSGEWRVIRSVDPWASVLFAFDVHFNGREGRDRYNVSNLALAHETLQPQIGSWLGFDDWFVPVTREHRREGTVVAGPFLRRDLSVADIRKQWLALTGTPVSPFDRQLLQYARAALAVPVFDSEQLAALLRLLELLARALDGQTTLPGDTHTLAKLRNTVYGRMFDSRQRRARMMLEPVTNEIWSEGELASYDRSELGISKMPNTVIAVTPGAQEGDALQMIVEGHRFHRRAVEWSAQFEALSTPLDDSGAYFLYYVDPALGPARRQRAMLDRTRAIAELARRELGRGVSVGIGGTTNHAGELPEFARRAAVALRLSALRGTRYLSYEEARSQGGAAGQARGPTARVGTLLERFTTGTDFTAACSEYVQSVLWDSAGQVGSIRAHLFGALDALISRMEDDRTIDAKSAADLRQRSRRLLDEAHSTDAVVQSFRDATTELSGLEHRPARSSLEFTLARAADFIKGHCTERLTLKSVAAHFGISPSYFSDRFKRGTKTGFAEYLRRARVERAKHLLRRSSLTIQRVSHEAGFVSVPHFNVAFKQVAGITPSLYRAHSGGRRDADTSSKPAIARKRADRKRR